MGLRLRVESFSSRTNYSTSCVALHVGGGACSGQAGGLFDRCVAWVGEA